MDNIAHRRPQLIRQGKNNALRCAHRLGVPSQQMRNFTSGHYWPQEKQLQFHAAARACDHDDGPTQILFGGARGPGKSHATFAQLALDDCRRIDGLKALYIRRVGRQAKEQFEDLRRAVLPYVPHVYKRQEGVIHIHNGSRIFVGNMRNEGDVENYLGIEYDVIAVEELTTLSETKFRALRSSNRTSKPGWRPRVYCSSNPGSIGHQWVRRRFILPHREETPDPAGETAFIPATVRDNLYVDKDYIKKLQDETGWRRRAYLDGDWDIAAGMYFTSYHPETHVIPHFDIPKHWRTFLAMDYGYIHPTVWYLFAENEEGVAFCMDEISEARLLPPEHRDLVVAMLKRHNQPMHLLDNVSAGGDVFQKKRPQDDEIESVADEYADAGISLVRADMDRLQGAAEVTYRLGNPATNRQPSVYISENCPLLAECLPMMIHDPDNPEDVLKVDVDEDGFGGDDPYDAFRYGLMSGARKRMSELHQSAAPFDPIKHRKRWRRRR